jgi:hypothetical protein
MAAERPANVRYAQYHGNSQENAGRTGYDQGKIFNVQKYGYAERKTLHYVSRNPYPVEKIGPRIKEIQQQDNVVAGLQEYSEKPFALCSATGVDAGFGQADYPQHDATIQTPLLR